MDSTVYLLGSVDIFSHDAFVLGGRVRPMKCTHPKNLPWKSRPIVEAQRLIPILLASASPVVNHLTEHILVQDA
jgi:hypothetical protein